VPNTPSDVDICNMALTRIGSTQQIQSITSPPYTDTETAQCALWYPLCRDELMTMFAWPWLSRYAVLAQVNTPGTRANNEWLYSYRYPTDCLSIERITSSPVNPAVLSVPLTSQPTVYPTVVTPELRMDGDAYPVPFRIGSDSSGRLIYTDQIGAAVKYRSAGTDPTQFSIDFAMLLAWRLAMELSYGLARSDERRKHAEEMFSREMLSVAARMRNENQDDGPYITNQAEGVRARQGWTE
jgi:hypothetical protein